MISLQTRAISCEQEVECFPVDVMASLAHFLPQAIGENQTQ